MNLPGQLSFTTLGDLLGQLHRASVSGILELVESHGAAAGRTHRVFLRDGLVDEVETASRGPRLGELLLREGSLGREGFAQLGRRLLLEPKRRAGEILVNERLASREAVTGGLRKQLRLRLDAVFALRDASVKFHVRPVVERAAATLGAADFLHNRPRARPRFTRAARSASHPRAVACRVLGVPTDADAETIQRAFRQQARATHPDSHPDASPAERALCLKRFAELSAAYHTLIDRG